MVYLSSEQGRVGCSARTPTSNEGGSLRDDSAKPGPFDRDASIELSAHGDYLAADVFALAVAVGPDHELLRVAGLRLEVSNEILRPPWIFNHGWRVKELEWVTGMPRLERGRKVELCEMACDIGDNECCTRFWIVESVVFYRWYVRINLPIPTLKMSFCGPARRVRGC